jgi:dTMP kinase
MHTPTTPPILVLEGLDGCGKTTLADKLADKLGARVLSTSAGMLANIRETCDALHGAHGLSRQLYYTYAVSLVSDAAARAQAAGQPVIIDRYWGSTIAYARCANPAAPWLHEIAHRLTPATLTIYLDLDASQRRERMIRRQPQLDPADADSLNRDRALRELLLTTLPALPTTGALRILDASRPPEALCADILRALTVSAAPHTASPI